MAFNEDTEVLIMMIITVMMTMMIKVMAMVMMIIRNRREWNCKIDQNDEARKLEREREEIQVWELKKVLKYIHIQGTKEGIHICIHIHLCIKKEDVRRERDLLKKKSFEILMGNFHISFFFF